jgi:flagellin
MRINHNIAALNTYRQLNTAAAGQSKSMEKLSSGLRINKAGDDAAGLAISEKMRGQIRGLDMAAKNAQDGISLIQTAEGALNETHSILQRMRELSVQASNDTLNSSDRGEIQKEVNQLVSEIDRIGNNTEFNTKKLLNGGAGIETKITRDDGKTATNVVGISGTGATQAGAEVVLGKTGADSVVLAKEATLTVAGTTGTALAAGDFTLNGRTFNVGAGESLADVAEKINQFSGELGVKAESDGTDLVLTSTGVGSAAKIEFAEGSANTFKATTDQTSLSAAGTDAVIKASAENTVDGATIAATDYTANGNTITIIKDGAKSEGLTFTLTNDLDTTAATTIKVEANNSLAIHIGSNEGQNMRVDINDMRAGALGVSAINVTSQQGADKAITTIQNAIETVSAERSKLGAFQNRLDHSINNLNTSSENLTAAESRIRDVDYALAA